MQGFLITAIAVLIVGIFICVYQEIIRRKSNNSLMILAVSVFVASMCIFIPIYSDMFSRDGGKELKIILLSLHNTIKLFLVDSDFGIITDFLGAEASMVATAYSLVAAILFIVAPILTFSIVLTLLRDVNASIRYLEGYGKETYVFSELNSKSLTLAKSIRSNGKKRMLIFADITESKEESDSELVAEAQELKAILFKTDVTSVKLKYHSKKKPVHFFAMAENEEKNLLQSMKLISLYKERENVHLYLFSSGVESEVLTSSIDKGNIKIRRVNPARALIENVLFHNGTVLFDSAQECDDGTKKIGAVILGMGEYGLSMLKGLSWYLQMDGYTSKIHCFDADEGARSKFEAMCPELLSDKLNKCQIKGESQYDINIYPGVDVEGSEFINILKDIKDITYVFVALGSDELNIRAAFNMRKICERLRVKPIIQAISDKKELNSMLNGMKNYRKQPYDVQFLGDAQSLYSEDVIVGSELENKALKLHCKWGKEEEFWAYEYNYHASVASVIHKKAREYCKIPGAGKKECELTEEETLIIQYLEHKRWNAYMRSEGYVYSGNLNERNDLGKMHHNLVPFEMLNSEDKEKDSRVGTD